MGVMINWKHCPGDCLACELQHEDARPVCSSFMNVQMNKAILERMEQIMNVEARKPDFPSWEGKESVGVDVLDD